MNRTIKYNSSKSGFTIVELAVVLFVIAIISAVLIANYDDWQRDITTTQLKSDLNNVASAMEDYRNFNNKYPDKVPATFRSSDGVVLSGGGLNSGKGYCVDATSESISYSISQHKTIFPGVCPVFYIDASEPSSYSGSGTNVNDISGDNNNVTLEGGVTFDKSTVGSLKFDGIDDWGGHILQPNIATGPNNFTVIGISKPEDQSGKIITPTSNGIDQFISYNSPSEKLNVNIAEADDLNERVISSPGGSMPLDKWTYWAVSINNKNVKIYINGNLVTESNETINIADWSSDWSIAQRGNSTFFYKGLMGMIGVYGHSLTDAEINSNFEVVRSKYGI